MKSRLILILLMTLPVWFSLPGETQTAIQLEGSPANWRLQNYAPNNITLWFTGSSCANGQLSADNLSSSDQSRLYATILAAKLSNASVLVFYSQSGASCEISSFGMDTPF